MRGVLKAGELEGAGVEGARGWGVGCVQSPTPQCPRGLPQATPHGTIPLSPWITTRQSLLYAGTPMKTSISTMRIAWTVCGVVGQVGAVPLAGESHAESALSPLTNSSLLRSLGPHKGPPGWQSLCPGATGSPPDTTSTFSRASPTPDALCQQRLRPLIHANHRTHSRIPRPAAPNCC